MAKGEPAVRLEFGVLYAVLAVALDDNHAFYFIERFIVCYAVTNLA